MRLPRSGSALALSVAGSRERREAMRNVSQKFVGWRPASEVLVRVRGVRTIFPWVNRATRVGGWPTDRVVLIHGPSNNGKTEFALGLGKSFLDLDHFFALVDAERTTPVDWLMQLGLPVDHPGFVALRPKSYEQTTDAVRSWAESIGEARERGEIPEDTTGLVVIDSIRKLVPKDLLKKILREGAERSAAENEADEAAAEEAAKKAGPLARRKAKRGIDGMGGRAAQYKAALNSAWMDEIIPLMADTGTAMAIITREIEDTEANPFSGKDYKLTGGKALFFDSSLATRVLSEKSIYCGGEFAGERHRVEIHKTKIGKKDEKVPRCFFHSSNGAFVEEGFDVARDLIDIGTDLGLVEQRGSHYWHAGKHLGNGEDATIRALYEKQALLRELDEAVRASIDAELDRERAQRVVRQSAA